MSLESEILRLVDALRREKDIDPEVIFQGIEAALLSAARKHFGGEEDIGVIIDRETGAISAYEGDREINPEELGRIAAQTAKQVMIQKIREAERDSIAHEFGDLVGQVIIGTVYRFEGPNMVINLGRTEGFLPRSEQIANETYRQGDRIRALIIEVKPVGTRVRVVLSRTRPELVERLFELEVPEVADGIVEVRAIAREAGFRTKIAVSSLDGRVDCVGACVGVQGSRIKNIVEELNGEKVDIVRWSDDAVVLVGYALKPAEIEEIILHDEVERATVIVPDDQLSLAIGKRGQNVRLATKLTGWEIDITSRERLEGGSQESSEDAPEAVEPAEGADAAEVVEAPEAAEAVDTADAAEVVEAPEAAEAVDAAEVVETPDAAEASDVDDESAAVADGSAGAVEEQEEDEETPREDVG